VPPERALGEDHYVVHRHFEDATGGRDQLDVGIGIRLLQLSRQTGGSGLVISDYAELDSHMHDSRLSAENASCANRSAPGNHCQVCALSARHARSIY
jgi:hypothetical protein